MRRETLEQILGWDPSRRDRVIDGLDCDPPNQKRKGEVSEWQDSGRTASGRRRER